MENTKDEIILKDIDEEISVESVSDDVDSPDEIERSTNPSLKEENNNEETNTSASSTSTVNEKKIKNAKYESLPIHLQVNELFYGCGDSFRDTYLQYKSPDSQIAKMLEKEYVRFPFIGVICTLPRMFFSEFIHDQALGPLQFVTSKDVFEYYVLTRVILIDVLHKKAKEIENTKTIDFDDHFNSFVISTIIQSIVSSNAKELYNVCCHYSDAITRYKMIHVGVSKEKLSLSKIDNEEEKSFKSEFIQHVEDLVDEDLTMLCQYGFKKWIWINEFCIYKLWSMISLISYLEELTTEVRNGNKNHKKQTKKFKAAVSALSNKSKLLDLQFYASDTMSEHFMSASRRLEQPFSLNLFFRNEKNLNAPLKEKIAFEMKEAIELREAHNKLREKENEDKEKKENEDKNLKEESDIKLPLTHDHV